MGNNVKTKDKIAVLVPSCDKYSDLWEPFFKLFKRFWSDCPYSIYLLSNNKQVDLPNVNNISVGDDISWSDNLLTALDKIQEEYILLFIDDLFLYDYVKRDKIERVLSWMVASNAKCVRLNPTIKPDKPFNDLIGVVSKGTIYRTSTVLSAWNKNTLKKLLKPGENAWEFEINGTIRSDIFDGFYSVWEYLFPVINGVIKGKWQRYAVKKISSLDVNIDLTSRKVMNSKETVKLNLLILRLKILNCFPPCYRRIIREFFMREKYKVRHKA